MVRAHPIMLAALPPVVALVLWRGSQDIFNTPKAALAVLAAGVIAAVELTQPRPRPLPAGLRAALGVYALGLVVGTLSAPSWLQAVVGRPGRHTGLAMGLATIVLFVVTARRGQPRLIAAGLVAGSVPVSLYALVQASGHDPLDWAVVEGGPQVFSTLGNAGFLSAWLGICFPFVLWFAVSASLSPRVRFAAGTVAVAAGLAMLGTASLQGPIIAAVGVVPVALGVASRRGRWLVLVAIGLVAAAAITAALVVAPLRLQLERSLQTRSWKWAAALSMTAAHPFIGVGLDGYADWFYAYRPIEVAVGQEGVGRPTDAAHSVPLHLLAGGGMLAGLGWLAAVGGVTVLIGRAWLRAAPGEQRLALGAVGGAWIAYLLQAGMSLDVPPLAVLGWTLGGAGVRLAWPQTAGHARRPRPALLGLPVVAVIVGASVIPLRADLIAGQGVRAMAMGQPERALAAFDQAAALAPWEPGYARAASDAAAALADWPTALDRARETIERGPRRLADALRLAQLEHSFAGPADADLAYARVLAIDSRSPATLLMVAEYELARDRPQRSTALLQRALAVAPDRADLWRALGQARHATGDANGAEQAFARATASE